MGLAILLIPIPHDRNTVISELKLKLFSVITVDSRTPIGIDITKTDGKCRIMIINATLNGIPYFAICLKSVINVSDANIIDVKINTPIINMDITCVNIYLSSSFCLLNLCINSLISLVTKLLYHSPKYVFNFEKFCFITILKTCSFYEFWLKRRF